MFDRYPENSRRILFIARGAALSEGATSISAVHILAGALEVFAGRQYQAVLQRLGLTERPQPSRSLQEIPFREDARRVLHTAMMIADTLGHHRIRPEHVLLALLDDRDDPVALALRDLGFQRKALVDSATREATLDDSPISFTAQLTGRIKHE